MNDEIKIMVCCHKPCEIPNNNIYLPIQVGRLISEYNLNIQSDCDLFGEVCDNISRKNPYYCEMTAMYWAWKNITKLFPDIKYVGLCHYRRFFYYKSSFSVFQFVICKLKALIQTALPIKEGTKLYDPIVAFSSVNNDKFYSNSNNLIKVIKKSDIVCTQPVKMLNVSNKYHFDCIGSYYIEALTEIIKQYYPTFFSSYIYTLNSKNLYAANMIILKTEYLDEYCNFIFGSLKMHEEYLLSKGYLRDLDEKSFSRVSGYLSEILTTTYINYKKKSGNIKVHYAGKIFIEK